jgi:hypothetical protein
MKRSCVLVIIGGILLSSGVSEGWDAEVHKRVTANAINQLRTGGYWSYARYIHENSYPDRFYRNDSFTITKYPIVLDPRLVPSVLPVANAMLPEGKKWEVGTAADEDFGLVENFVVSANWADVFKGRTKNDIGKWDYYPFHGLFLSWLVDPAEDFYEWADEDWKDGERMKALRWIGRACHFMGDATYPGRQHQHDSYVSQGSRIPG